MNSLSQRLLEIPTPTVEEIDGLHLTEHIDSPLLVEHGKPTEAYVEIQKLYRLLFSDYFLSKTKLDQLDAKLGEFGYITAPEQERNFFQKYDCFGLRYFYLRSYVHIERLEDEQLQVLWKCCQQTDNQMDAEQLIKETYQTVLAYQPKQPKVRFELFPSMDGSGLVRGSAIVVAAASMGTYDSNGMILDYAQNNKRIRQFSNMPQKLEPLLAEKLGAEIKVIVEV